MESNYFVMGKSFKFVIDDNSVKLFCGGDALEGIINEAVDNFMSDICNYANEKAKAGELVNMVEIKRYIDARLKYFDFDILCKQLNVDSSSFKKENITPEVSNNVITSRPSISSVAIWGGAIVCFILLVVYILLY